MLTMCQIDDQWELAVWLRELKLELCDCQEMWEWVGGQRDTQEGGDVCIPVAVYLWLMCGRDQHNLQSNYPLIKNKHFFFFKWVMLMVFSVSWVIFKWTRGSLWGSLSRGWPDQICVHPKGEGEKKFLQLIKKGKKGTIKHHSTTFL